MMTTYDHLIVGQGLAGTALAWALSERGESVCVIDRVDAVTSSKIAAGLMTPITGQRLVKQERWDELIGTALPFYRRIEAIAESEFLFKAGAVRTFADEREREIYRRKCEAEFGELVRNPNPPLDGGDFAMPFGSFELPAAARLACGSYLRASRTYFETRHRWVTADVNSADLRADRGGVAIDSLGIRGHGLTFCKGFAERNSPAFSPHWQAAKGEILTLRVPGLTETRTVHRGVWLTAHGGDLFRAGSTYEWVELDDVPTEAKCREIVERLKIFLRRPFEVVSQQAAVRPILRDQMPAIGADPEIPCVYHFNGLGSKGALFAPWVAARLADHLVDGTAIPPKIDLARFRGPSAP